MNQRNWEVLLQLLKDFGLGEQSEFSTEVLAEYLASRGVLVPSVLTDKALANVAECATYEGAKDLLERIAKGTA